jgi:hypothetical protein
MRCVIEHGPLAQTIGKAIANLQFGTRKVLVNNIVRDAIHRGKLRFKIDCGHYANLNFITGMIADVSTVAGAVTGKPDVNNTVALRQLKLVVPVAGAPNVIIDATAIPRKVCVALVCTASQ